MWMNVFLFLVAAATAAYFYITRKFGWFKARGVYEHDPAFPFGCHEVNQTMMGKVAFTRSIKPVYFK